ncbi:hypothetical protein C0995_015041 [Termitomyces sp. Mi166|nr:hypothetical protein C0995_015041 [Termitomyces sp. Mi166\
MAGKKRATKKTKPAENYGGMDPEVSVWAFWTDLSNYDYASLGQDDPPRVVLGSPARAYGGPWIKPEGRYPTTKPTRPLAHASSLLRHRKAPAAAQALVLDTLDEIPTTRKRLLDSLPKPFHWRLETQEEQNTASGNNAFVRKDRAGALKAYDSAIDPLIDLLSMNPDYDDEVKAKKQLAFCYGNRAAAHMMPGDGINLKQAINDGKSAEYYDARYAKAYIRQASAYQQLGDLDAAKDTIARGLRLPQLENNKDLVDRLIELYMDGKNLSDDEGVFKDWVLDITTRRALKD